MTTNETQKVTVVVCLAGIQLQRQVAEAAHKLGYSIFHATRNANILYRLPQRAILITDESWLEDTSPEPIDVANRLYSKRVMLHIVRQGNVDGALKSIRAGACHVLEQPVDDSVLLNNIRAAAELEVGFARQRTASRSHKKIDSLNPTEAAIFIALIKGKTNKEIAKELGIALRAVEFARAQIMVKLEVTTLAQLVAIVTSKQVRAAIGTLCEFETMKSWHST